MTGVIELQATVFEISDFDNQMDQFDQFKGVKNTPKMLILTRH